MVYHGNTFARTGYIFGCGYIERLPEELVAALERQNQETGKTLTEVIIETLEAGLVAQERPGPEAETLRGLSRDANRAKEILDKALRRIKS